MRFPAAAVAVFSAASATLLCSEVSAFATHRGSPAFVSHVAVPVSQGAHKAACTCPACTGVHKPGCACSACVRVGRTVLFADTTAETETADEEASPAEEDVPAEVEAMDGIASPDEAHNAERPARESLKTKKRVPKGKPLSEFSEGESVTAKVKTITSYGAFMDIGAQTDGLLHISQLAQGFISDVNEVLEVGQEVEARILTIDAEKGQVALSLLTEEEQERAAERPRRQERPRQQRRDDSAVLSALEDKGWDPEKFVEGKVVSTVAFGAFVRLDASKLNPEVEGELDGLVHISSLSVGRAESVTGIVNSGDVVQVRVKGIQGGKVSLSMISPEDEQAPRGGSAVIEGAKDWKEQLEKAQQTMPEFQNGPLVVDLRK